MDMPLQGVSSQHLSLMVSPDFKFIFSHAPNIQFLPENTDPYNNIIIYNLHV